MPAAGIFGISLKDKAVLFRQLATLMESGVPAMRMFAALQGIENRKVQQFVSTASSMMAEGKPLSEAMERYPGYFEDIVIQMVKAGELGGTLELRLKNIADYFEKEYELKTKLVSKLIYPIVIVHAAIFIPPLPVLFLKGFGQYAMLTLLPIFLLYFVVFGTYISYRLFASTRGIAALIDNVLISLPLFGKLTKAVASYRFLLVLSELTDAGVALDLAVKSAANAAGNAAFAEKIGYTIRDIQSGMSLSKSLSKAKLIPEISMQMIITGEESGNLSEMIRKAAEYLNLEINEALKRIYTIIPLLLYIFVLIYGGFMVVMSFIDIYKPIMTPSK